jgi:predicted nuclease with TOPRIM domain
MSVSQKLWPEPDELFDWFGDANLSRDSQTAAVVAVAAGAIQKAYTEWHAVHREASAKIVELQQDAQDATADRVDGTLKAKIKRLEKELRAAREGAGESAGLEHQLLKSQGEVVEWKTRFDELFEMNKRTNRLVDANNALRGTAGAERVQNTVVHKIKPREPANFDGSQDLEVVTALPGRGRTLCAAGSVDVS